MELGLWRIETRHKMCALRLLRDILLGDPSSQLRAIYNTYLQRGARMAYWVMVRLGSPNYNTARRGSSPLQVGLAACGKGHRATS